MEQIYVSRYNSQLMQNPKIPDIDLMQLFRSVRIDLHMTQQEMAKYIGANIRAYQRWEEGSRIPNGKYTAKVCWLRNHLDNVEKPK